MKNKSQEIYVHIPFCERKCAYCDFVSFVRDDSVKEAYFKRLYEQIELKSEFTGDIPVDSVFFGGGTPSAVASEFINETMNVLQKFYNISAASEITMEMNPNSVTVEKLKIYKEAGINRISMGLQSTDNNELKLLSRLHTYEEFLKAYEAVRTAGFTNVNIDLMSALPGQTRESYADTLNKVIKLCPEHISAYSLIIEEGTPFFERYKTGAGLPDEDTEREMYYDTKLLLHNAGYERYEISNYSRPGYECRHNIGYWTRKQYVGLGIAAASLIDDTRYQMHNDLEAYQKGDFSEGKEILSTGDRMSETMILGLRMTLGVSRKSFAECYGVDPCDVYKEQINRLVSQGLMKVSPDSVFLTEKGLDLANVCMVEFV